MPRLKPHQQDLLVRIVRNGGLPAREADGRLLRPPRSAALVRVDGDRVVPTRVGRRLVPASVPPPDRTRLNPRQEDLLRMILRRCQVPGEELDGCVARPLIARGLATLSGDRVVSPTSAGRAYFEDPPTPSLHRRTAVPENARAAAVRRAVRRLEAAVPPGSEVLVGSTRASADVPVDAFLRRACGLEQAP
jgi:hypothetical protein